MRVNIIILFLGLAFLTSCDQKAFDSNQELIAYVKNENNGYRVNKSIRGIDMSIMYRPTDLLVEQKTDSQTSKKEIDSLRIKYSQYLYFNLNLSKGGNELLSAIPNDNNEFGEMVNQLSFGMNKVIHLYSSKKDTIQLVDYVYPRMYGLSKSTELLLIYPRDPKITNAESFTISIDDIGLKTGEVKFKFNTSIVNEELKINFE